MQRQYAAGQFIKYLYQGWEIINVDESIVNYTDQKTQFWHAEGQKHYLKRTSRLNRVSLIAGISSTGNFYFSCNQGFNNFLCVYHFLLKLVLLLDQRDSTWRKHTIILLDNSPTHRSRQLLRRLEMLKVPIFFLGPYHFNLAPAEKFFSYVKNFDLNPEGINYNAQYVTLLFLILL